MTNQSKKLKRIKKSVNKKKMMRNKRKLKKKSKSNDDWNSKNY